MFKRLVAVIFIFAIGGSAPAWAKWGCAARGGSAWANNYAYDTEAEARRDALRTCVKAKGKGCHIIGCNAKIESAEETLSTWPAPSKATIECGPQHEKKC